MGTTPRISLSVEVKCRYEENHLKEGFSLLGGGVRTYDPRDLSLNDLQSYVTNPDSSAVVVVAELQVGDDQVLLVEEAVPWVGQLLGAASKTYEVSALLP